MIDLTKFTDRKLLSYLSLFWYVVDMQRTQFASELKTELHNSILPIFDNTSYGQRLRVHKYIGFKTPSERLPNQATALREYLNTHPVITESFISYISDIDKCIYMICIDPIAFGEDIKFMLEKRGVRLRVIGTNGIPSVNILSQYETLTNLIHAGYLFSPSPLNYPIGIKEIEPH